MYSLVKIILAKQMFLENPFNKCKDFEATYTNCYNINKEYKYIEMKNLLIRTLNQNFPIISFN